MGKGESVIIVGGGVIGIACAHYLNRAGLSVTLIEKDILAGACSHGNCGFICPSHVLPLTEPGAIQMAMKSLLKPSSPFRVKPRLSPSLWHWMFQFARRCRHENMIEAGAHLKSILDASMTEYRRLFDDEGLLGEWQENGLLYVLKTDKGMEDFARTDALLNENFGVAAQRIEGAALTDFDGALRADLAGAFFYEDDAQVRPDVLCRNWVECLRDRGVDFLTACELQTVRRERGEVVAIQTSHGELTADRYVFALGALSGRLGGELGCSIPVEPGKGYSVTMRRPNICPKHSILFPEHKVGVTPFEEGYRLGSMMEFAGFDESIPASRIQQLRDSAEPYLLEPYSSDPEQEVWYGWRPMTWDSLPIIGATPNLKNAFLATGHNMLGLSLAPSTGRLLTELMLGEKPHIDPSGFRPDRF
jgi:D-amino-acid dehydrogenase